MIVLVPERVCAYARMDVRISFIRNVLLLRFALFGRDFDTTARFYSRWLRLILSL
jgi:hypothetical protein